jgi:PfaD family protein
MSPAQLLSRLGEQVEPSVCAFDGSEIIEVIQRVRDSVGIVRDGVRLGVLAGGPLPPAAAAGDAPGCRLVGVLPALYPEWLGDRSFGEAHRVRFPYVVGEMANGLTTTRMVIEAARAGFLAFFGAAGLDPDRIEAAVLELDRALGDRAGWGSNLIHSPHEPALEDAAVEIYLRHGVRRVSASAYLALTPPVVRYAAAGLSRDARGRIRRRNHLFAKISRPETARLFLSPAPPALLDALVAAGKLRREEAELALRVPLAEDVTVEADSGGHTDNRPLTAIFPVIAALRDEIAAREGYGDPIRVGAAGGLGTPAALAAAFALGAAYVLTGSVNQAAVESGLGAGGRELLAAAGVADVMMAPAADMFEMGVKVQVLRRGTLFGPRAQRLAEVYKSCPSLEAIPAADRLRLENEIFRRPLAAVWEETERFWAVRDPAQVERAAREPKHRMALCFRWYLGQASRWAIEDDASRRSDFQIWSGPAIGAFNEWVRGSFLAEQERRTVAQIGLNLLEGAAVAQRAQQLRSAGVPVPAAGFQFRPRPLG